jgi:hypothetical protein
MLTEFGLPALITDAKIVVGRNIFIPFAANLHPKKQPPY